MSAPKLPDDVRKGGRPPVKLVRCPLCPVRSFRYGKPQRFLTHMQVYHNYGIRAALAALETAKRESDNVRQAVLSK